MPRVGGQENWGGGPKAPGGLGPSAGAGAQTSEVLSLTSGPPRGSALPLKGGPQRFVFFFSYRQAFDCDLT